MDEAELADQQPTPRPDDAPASPARRAGRPRTEDLPAVSRDRQILEAAIKVFAEHGYHQARVSDIARQAGVAYGLVYHYFPTKEALLERIFQRSWSQLSEGLHAIRDGNEPGADKLAAVVRLMLGSYRLAPELVRVLILEVTRSAHLRRQVQEIQQAFAVIEHIIREAQTAGEFRDDIDPRLVSYVFWGAIDEVLTGWVFEALPSEDADVGAAERALVELILRGVCQTPSRGQA